MRRGSEFIVISLLLLVNFNKADEENMEETKAPFEIITKYEWNGKNASDALTTLHHPIKRIVICHTSTRDCASKETCSERVRVIQEFHMTSLRFSDIGYNFLIGNDGGVYEGRGWDYEGAFARGYNANSLAISFVGTYENNLPIPKALDALKTLIEEGIAQGKIDADYKLIGHRQLTATNSPGTKLYDTIKKWEHWSQDISV